MTIDKLNAIRTVLIDNIYRNEYIMFDDHIRNYDDDDEYIDLVDIITDLYEYLHKEVTGESYDYMFHWANKVGSDTRCGYIDELIKRGNKNGNK